MARFVVLVIDSFGVGAMKDVTRVRPQDAGANTCGHILGELPQLRLPTLEKLGLINALGFAPGVMKPSESAVWGVAELQHEGGDTFMGHQEILGTRPQAPLRMPFSDVIDRVEQALKVAGWQVERRGGDLAFLWINDAVAVGDNLEADLGQVYNVTANLSAIAFDEVLKIGRVVREQVQVGRVITFGGRGVHLQNLLDAIEEHGDYIGVNAPASGVYNNDYHCIHMGYGVDPEVQMPTILGKSGLPVFLLGKVADVVTNNYGTSIPMVDTASVLKRTLEIVQEQETAFICTNVQETDLCGHRENVAAYADRLRVADEWIGKIREALGEDDILIVQADHGNDPTIGHPHHTREMVPLMIYSKHSTPKDIGTRKTLSDVGATAAEYFHSKAPQNGTSFLPLLLK